MMTRRGDFPDINGETRRLKRTVPHKIANVAKNHYLEGFRLGGKRTNASKAGWQPRKDNKDEGRAILVKSGAMRNSLDVREANFKQIIVGTLDIPYADVNNEGFGRVPKREFLGDSDLLNKRLSREIVRILKRSYGR